MKLLDANLLIYSVNKDADLHLRAVRWLENVLSGDETVGLSWNVVLAFLRISTRTGLFRRPLEPNAALDLIDRWLEHPLVEIVEPGPAHLSILRQLISTLGTAGNLASDAHLAALAIEHRAELCSCDTDFSRFPGLRWTNPLAAAKLH
jgi:toxin-antitoxin system PIN domain toxin